MPQCVAPLILFSSFLRLFLLRSKLKSINFSWEKSSNAQLLSDCMFFANELIMTPKRGKGECQERNAELFGGWGSGGVKGKTALKENYGRCKYRLTLIKKNFIFLSRKSAFFLAVWQSLSLGSNEEKTFDIAFKNKLFLVQLKFLIIFLFVPQSGGWVGEWLWWWGLRRRGWRRFDSISDSSQNNDNIDMVSSQSTTLHNQLRF